jgi:hypothetical protein
MKTISLKNGLVIFLDQIAFIHVQPSFTKEGTSTPEVHVHFPAALTGPKGGRSMRAVVTFEHCDDFINQLEKHGVECNHLRRSLSELNKS